MQPKSPHWADQAAAQVINRVGEKDKYVVASGITPSGVVHIGNFREVITAELVARALRDLGKQVRFIYSWDNFDTFRKVPKNIPEGKDFTPYLFQPIARIPDPWEESSSYAQGRINLFESELREIGVDVEFLYQEEKYGSAEYAEQIKTALENTAKIKAVLDQFRSQPLDETWLPTAVYCEKCHKDKMHHQKYLGEWQYEYHCASCSHQGTVDIRKCDNLKLNWRVDWPMRWAYEGVDFEPGGKDHSSQGGSFDTASKIVKTVWDKNPPIYLQYDMVGIKGGVGKMSSSSGDVFTLRQLYEIYEPQMIRWLFATHRPNHDFSIALDEDVIKMYDEFDRAEATYFTEGSGSNKKKATANRSFEFSFVSQKYSEGKFRAPFRELCNRLQICGGDIKRTVSRFYPECSEAQQHEVEARSVYAWNWLKKYAPESFCYSLEAGRRPDSIDDSQKKSLVDLRELLTSTDLDTISSKDLSQKIHDQAIKPNGLEGKEFFKLVYQCLIGRDQGPRLAGFLKEIGIKELQKKLT